MALTIVDILRAINPNIGLIQNPDGTFRIGVEDVNSDEILTAVEASTVDLAALEIINTAIQVAVEAGAVDLAAIEIINTAIQVATEASAVDLAAIEVINTDIQTAVEAINTTTGATGDAIVAAGAAGSLSAKLRRVTQGLEDLKTLTVLAAGTNTIGYITPPSTLACGSKSVTTAGAREALAGSTACKEVILTANAGNTNYIYVGDNTVSNAVYMKRILAGEEFSVSIDNLSKIYLDSAVNGEGVTFGYLN